ncbi:MAG: energy transducer TonB [Bacteroidia bacterium]
MKKLKYLITVLSVLTGVNSFSQIAQPFDAFPTNVGGKTEFKRIFNQEVVYPDASLKNKKGGQVTVYFTIEKDSSVKDISVSSTASPDLDKEAMRLFKLYKWVPAIKAGNYVTAKWSAVFDFDPDKYRKICKERGFVKFSYYPDAKLDSSSTIYSGSGVQMPAYQKGNFALQDFIKANLEYPRQAQLSNIQGTVVLSFVVEPSGLVTNIGIEKSVGGGCDQEAIRVLQLIDWYPGKHDEKFARIAMTFPFNFILNEDFKDNSNGEQK